MHRHIKSKAQIHFKKEQRKHYCSIKEREIVKIINLEQTPIIFKRFALYIGSVAPKALMVVVQNLLYQRYPPPYGSVVCWGRRVARGWVLYRRAVWYIHPTLCLRPIMVAETKGPSSPQAVFTVFSCHNEILHASNNLLQLKEVKEMMK